MNATGVSIIGAMAFGFIGIIHRRDPLWVAIQVMIYLRALLLLLGRCVQASWWEIKTQRGACLARARRAV